MNKEWMQRALKLAELVGMKNLAPVDDTYITTFKVVPTTK
jgi:hypothetical protein